MLEQFILYRLILVEFLVLFCILPECQDYCAHAHSDFVRALGKKMRCACLVLTVLCLRLAGSEDLYWRPNTDWSNPSNWGLGRAPCEGDVADLSSVSSPWLCVRGLRHDS